MWGMKPISNSADDFHPGSPAHRLLPGIGDMASTVAIVFSRRRSFAGGFCGWNGRDHLRCHHFAVGVLAKGGGLWGSRLLLADTYKLT